MKRMNRFLDNLSQEDRRTYRWWTGALFLSYAAAIVIAIGVTYFKQPSGDLWATNETRMARLKPASSLSVFASSPSSVRP